MSEARYEIIRQLACGGMAEVLLARQNADDGSARLVVLKRVLAHLSQNDGFLKMFAHEARIASQLRHQNIVQVLEVGEVEGLPVIVMERLEGADLLRLLQQCVTRRQSLGTAVSMAILAGAARGLGYAHRARSSDGRALRLVHRDISPHNVFITRDGGVKLLDFGIAKSAAHVGLTSTGQVKGKISYMSPEQIRSMPIDARSDLWSLGVVLWETLAGEKLFTRDNDAATLHAILHDPIPPLNRREAPGLDDLIARVLQRDPAARVGTAEEIAAALEGMLESMRAGPAAKIVAQRVASLVPALSPEFDLARPAAAPSHEVVTLAVGPAAAPSTPRRAPGISPFAVGAAPPPPLPVTNRYAQGNNPPPARGYDDDVAVDDEPTQMDMPTASSMPPPDEETTRAVTLPTDEQTVERPSVAPGRASPPASPPRSSQTPRPPVLPGAARPPINPRSRTSTVMGTGSLPLPPPHGELGDDPEPLTAQVPRPATIAPPRNATPMMMAPTQPPMGAIPAPMSPSMPPDDLFGSMPGPDAASPSLAPPSLNPSSPNALRPGASSPFSNNPLAGFAARSPDTFVAAEIARPVPPPPPSRAGRWIVATGALMVAVFAGVVVSQRMRAPAAPVATTAPTASEPMQVVHVPETAPSPVPAPVAEPTPAPAVAAAEPTPADEPVPAAAAEPTAAPAEATAPAPVAVAAPVAEPTPAPAPVAVVAPAPVAVPAPAPAAAPVVAPAPVAVAARAPTPAPVARPRVVPTPAPARVAAAPAPVRPVAAPAPARVAAAPAAAARPAPLMDPFDTTAASPTRPRAPAPVAAPARVAAAPTPVTRAPATPVRRPNDPFDNVYRDPTQRRTARPPVQAPPSARTGAIATEF